MSTTMPPSTDNLQGQQPDALIEFRLTASFLEVYGEDIHDLLDEDRKSLPLREDSNGEVIVVGLRNTTVTSDVEAMNILNTGTMNRTTASTLMNRTSSRSHAVFIVNLQQTTRGSVGDDVTTTSRFTFVDLAGSERLKKTGAEGERAREGIKINEGLLALGNVINALADEGRLARGEKVHVPYRQSKLTRLLQDALGGNSQTLFLACVSPSDTNANETLSTLQYANRARNIRNAPTRNVDATALELQRLRSLANVLKCELIKNRFSGVNPEVERQTDSEYTNEVGILNEELAMRDDVVSYMNLIDQKAAELVGSTANVTFSLAVHPDPEARMRPTTVPSTLSPMRFEGRSISPHSSALKPVPITNSGSMRQDDDVDALILDVNPEEDMQIIDQLLELQHLDQKFNNEQKDDQEKLDNVEGEIEAQEGRLLQLRERLEVYHSMKEKYERLMCEVHSLESEKQALASELEKAQVDPTKGCSVAIKRKLEKVEESLARARSETRKHQQMYRQAEQEAQKCKVLERKIQDLKHAKVALIKKQREDAARHKEFTNQKTREIQALKRKEKNADKKISKMEADCQKYKSNLERSRSQCEKLSDKLKQTESHLMRLLTKRRNDLNRNINNSRESRVNADCIQHDLVGLSGFAAAGEEVKSIKFLLEKTVSDRVTLSIYRQSYESKIVEHGKLMQSIAKEVRKLKKRKRAYQSLDQHDSEVTLAEIKECEEAVQDLQLKLELVENDLDQLRAKCPSVEDSEEDAKENIIHENASALKLISKLEGPALRTLLWNFLESLIHSELQRRNMKDLLARKQSALKSFENEVVVQNNKIDALSKSLGRRRKLNNTAVDDNDHIQLVESLENEIIAVKARLDICNDEKTKLISELKKTRDAMSKCQEDQAKSEEMLALIHSEQKLTETTEETTRILRQLQEAWADIGLPMSERESVRQKLENCVEDACCRMLGEAIELREEKIQAVKKVQSHLEEVYAALGISDGVATLEELHSSPISLNAQLETLNNRLREIQPQFDHAMERYTKLSNDANSLIFDLQLKTCDLTDNIKLISQGGAPEFKRRRQGAGHRRTTMAASREARAKVFKHVENLMKDLDVSDLPTDPYDDTPLNTGQSGNAAKEPGCLSIKFLDDCERDIKKLRVLKSEKMLSNVEKCENIRSIAKEMHANLRDLSTLVIHNLKKRRREFPDWWDNSTSDQVFEAVSKKGSTIVNESFTKHLDLTLETLRGITHGRKLLSDTLKQVIEDSHDALLATAEDCQMDIKDLYKSLHKALFDLPHLSKQHIQACIDEMQMLVTAAESIAQSEIETLTVLWEGLNLSSNERGKFWGELEELSSKIEMDTTGPFDTILGECPAGVEEWVLKSITEATKVQRMLGIRVFKLKRLHGEVERLRRKQEAKNKIMSINSKLNVLSTKLAEFEEKAGNKHRLLNKKANSSTLLEEARFRKQMQGMFSAELETLGKLLNEWEVTEGKIEDSDMLSDVVKSMLENSHRIDAWMNERTRFMHLRTTKAKSKAREYIKPELQIVAGSTHPRSNLSSYQNSLSSQNKVHLLKKPSSGEDTVMSVRSALHTRRTGASKSPPLQSVLSTVESSVDQHKKRIPLSDTDHNSQPDDKASKKKKISINIKADESSGVLLPFGNLLAETPTHKENSSKF